MEYIFGMKLILHSFEKYIRNGSIKGKWIPRFQRLCLYLRNQVARGIRQRDRNRRVRLTMSVYKYTRVSFSMPSHVTIHFPTGVVPDILILPDNPHFVLYVHVAACVQLGFSIAFPTSPAHFRFLHIFWLFYHTPRFTIYIFG